MLGTNSQTPAFNTILLIALVALGALTGILIAIYGFSPLIVAVPLALIFLLITVNKPWIALSAFFLLVPLENLFVLEGELSATGSKLIGAYLIFLMLICGRLKYISEVFRHKKTLWIIGFLLAALISTLFSDIASALFENLLRLFIFTALYIVLIVMIRDIKTLTYCLQALVAGAALSVLSPLILGTGSTGGIDLQRYGGLWGDQNEFAAILLVIIPFSLMLYQYERKKIMKMLYGASFMVILIGFFLTYSRGGFVAFLVLFLLASYRIIKSKHRVKILAIFIPAVIVLSAVFYNTIADEYISRVETLRAIQNNESAAVDGSIKLRYIYYFEVAPEIFFNNPIFGVGPGGFIHYNTYLKQVAHNTYIEILIGMGLLGFIPFLVILYLTWREVKATQFTSIHINELKLLYYYSTALEFGFISLLVAGMFISLDLNKILWLSITLSTVMANILRNQILSERNLSQSSYS